MAQCRFALATLADDIVETAIGIQLNLDVFDMGILSTAKSKDLPLITKDGVITQSKVVEILW